MLSERTLARLRRRSVGFVFQGFHLTALEATRPLAIAQLLPALPGAAVGAPVGVGLCWAFSAGPIATPPLWWLLTAGLAVLLAVAALSAFRARNASRRSVVRSLSTETP